MQRLVFFFILLVFSCNEAEIHSRIDAKPIVAEIALYMDHAMYRGWGKSEEAKRDAIRPPVAEPFAIELGWKKMHPGSVSVPLESNSDSILRALFPGKISQELRDDVDTMTMVWWLCKDCKREVSRYDFMPDMSDTLPNKEWNTTIILDDTIVKGKKNNYRFFFFHHTSEISPEFCGRFSGANLGAALFIEERGKWKLINFNPVIGCYGTYGRPRYPLLHEIGTDKWVFSIGYANGGAGGAYTGMIDIFFPQNGTFKRAHHEQFVYLWNTGFGNWNSQVLVSDATVSTTIYSDIVIETNGFFHSGGEDFFDDEDWVVEQAPAKLKKKMKESQKNKTAFDFEMKRKYYHSGGNYILYSTDVKFSPRDTLREEFRPAYSY